MTRSPWWLCSASHRCSASHETEDVLDSLSGPVGVTASGSVDVPRPRREPFRLRSFPGSSGPSNASVAGQSTGTGRCRSFSRTSSSLAGARGENRIKPDQRRVYLEHDPDHVSLVCGEPGAKPPVHPLSVDIEDLSRCCDGRPGGALLSGLRLLTRRRPSTHSSITGSNENGRGSPGHLEGIPRVRSRQTSVGDLFVDVGIAWIQRGTSVAHVTTSWVSSCPRPVSAGAGPRLVAFQSGKGHGTSWRFPTVKYHRVHDASSGGRHRDSCPAWLLSPMGQPDGSATPLPAPEAELRVGGRVVTRSPSSGKTTGRTITVGEGMGRRRNRGRSAMWRTFADS